MWDFDGFIDKAVLYFRRAQEHEHDDDEFAIWLLLGLEFLLRAPLAQENPTLLADSTGESIMHAAGFPGGSNEPRSISTNVVISRLGRIIEAFNKERQDDARVLSGLRNEELHTSTAALAIETVVWLPKFTRVVDVICEHLSGESEELVGQEIILQGRALVDAEDKKLLHHVQQRIAASRDLFSRLRENEKADRRSKVPKSPTRRAKSPIEHLDLSDEHREVLTTLLEAAERSRQWVSCPACGDEVPMRLQEMRRTGERLEEGEILRTVFYVATSFECPVCDLTLSSTAEIRAAGLQQQFSKQERESIEERYLSTYEAPDYHDE